MTFEQRPEDLPEVDAEGDHGMGEGATCTDATQEDRPPSRHGQSEAGDSRNRHSRHGKQKAGSKWASLPSDMRAIAARSAAEVTYQVEDLRQSPPLALVDAYRLPDGQDKLILLPQMPTKSEIPGRWEGWMPYGTDASYHAQLVAQLKTAKPMALWVIGAPKTTAMAIAHRVKASVEDWPPAYVSLGARQCRGCCR